jgi:hypothetical protein
MTEFIRGAWMAERTILVPAARKTSSSAVVKLASRQPGEDQLEAELEALVAVAGDGAGHIGQDRETVRGQLA